MTTREQALEAALRDARKVIDDLEASARAYSDGALRVLSHIDAALAMPVEGWRTMESAPKDGTAILVVYDPERCYSHPMAVVWWASGIGGFTNSRGQVEKFTHWQPLPPPPEKP